MMRANLKPPGKCIFCGRGGLTKEHMWADWLRNYIPRAMLEHVIGDIAIFPEKHELRSLKHREGDPHSRKIRCVCRDCNNGWMSQLQEDAKPFLLPALTGKQTILLRKGQLTLSAWIAMMVMVAEYANRDKVAIPTSDRRWLLTKRQPPSHWRIWIGSHVRTHYPLFMHHVLSFSPTEQKFESLTSETPAVLNTQTSTICLGEHLLIHVMSSAPLRSILHRWHLPPGIELAMSQIWPVRDRAVMWPNGIALADGDISALAQQFVLAANAIVQRGLSIV